MGNGRFFANLMKNTSLLNEKYMDKYKSFCDKVAKDPKKYDEIIKMKSNIIGSKKDIRLLDVGCGDGNTIIELANNGIKCVGIDAYKECIVSMNKLKKHFDLDIECIYGDASNLPFKDASFDSVMSEEFFEHVADIDHALNEQVRVLKLDGRLILEQSNLFNPLSLYDLLVSYPRRTNGKYGGIKWLFHKNDIVKNLYGMGWNGRDEDIHSRNWWKSKIMMHPNLKLEETSSYIAKRCGGLFKIIGLLFGNILIIAKKI